MVTLYYQSLKGCDMKGFPLKPIWKVGVPRIVALFSWAALSSIGGDLDVWKRGELW